jgi:phosphoglycolate phosphatase
MIKGVLFDLDGTLLDTSAGILSSVRYTLERLDIQQLPKKTLLKFVGPPIQCSLMQYVGLNEQQAQEGANIFRSYYKDYALYEASLYPGIHQLLTKLKDNGVKIGVATYKREDYAIDLLKHFGIADFCDVMHGADNENKLTKADIVSNCISELNESKSNVVLIGDTAHDAMGAYDAGVGFIAVTWGFGYHPQEEPSDYPYKAVANDVEQLGEIIRELNKF